MKNNSSISISVAIIIGFIILGLFLMATFEGRFGNVVSNNNDYRYEMISANENNIIIFDKKSGEYWNKYLPSNEGPTNWEKGDFPITNGDR